MEPTFTLHEVRPAIFLLKFQREYDMCMFFLRYQEFYESSSSKFRGKKFEILDFMRWYSLTLGDGAFTYPIDWSGFNIPSYIVKQVRDLHISDKNMYDYEMWEVYKQCRDRVGDKFYLIGVSKKKGAESTLAHEIAHGLFYLNAKYKKEMSALVKQMDVELRQHMHDFLKKLGYSIKVYVDEIQAYMSTTEDFTKNKHFVKEVGEALIAAQPPFRQVLKRYLDEKK